MCFYFISFWNNKSLWPRKTRAQEHACSNDFSYYKKNLCYRISKPMEYGTVKFACLEEAVDHPLKPVVITVRCNFSLRVYILHKCISLILYVKL